MYLAKELPQHSKEAKKPLFAPSELYSKSIIVLESPHGCWIKKKAPSDRKNPLKKLNVKKSDSDLNHLKPVASSKNTPDDSEASQEVGSDVI